MRRGGLNNIILITLVVMIAACKTRKAAVVTPPVKGAAAVNSKKAENIRLLRSKDAVYNTLSLKGKASLNINGDVNNVTVNIRMKRDQKIWMSITAIAGIEVARALITPDSILLLNRLQGTYMEKPFSYIYGFTNKQINFKMLQSILTGNTIDDFMLEPAAQLEFANGTWGVNGNHTDLNFTILFNTLLKITQMNLNDARSGQALKVVYDNYQQVNAALFPSGLNISSMAGIKKIGINFNFSKIESNVPLDFPFSAPKRFQVIN